jgi:hypothetical protein
MTATISISRLCADQGGDDIALDHPSGGRGHGPLLQKPYCLK